MQDIHGILKQYWGFDRFRPLQEDIIRSVLGGKDTLALMPTGGGKSICFQVPGLAMEGICLVISPLIALMKDQVHNLNRKGISAAAIYSGLPYKTIDILLDNCVVGKVKFLYVSPERLASDDFRVRLNKMKVSLLVVDEAHCVSQWGYDFRPNYLRIAEVRETLKNVPVIALTATATPEVVTDIQQKLLFKQPNVLKKSFVRHNLSYVVRQSQNKQQSMLDILAKVPGSAVVYVRNRKRTRDYANFLSRNGISANNYHAGLEPNERSKKQEEWMKNKTRVICCTNAFGMGIDKPDVRVVIHMDAAESVEAYFQEAGRAGRDEKKAYAVQLYNNSDCAELDEKIKDGFPTIDFIRNTYHSLCTYLRIAYNDGQNRGYDLDIGHFAETEKLNPVKVISALKILEQQELLFIPDSVYQLSAIKCVCTKETLAEFQQRNASLEPLVKFILRTSEGVFEDYVSLDEQAIAPRLKLSTDEVVARLKRLDELRIFSYQPRKNKPQIVFLHNRVKKEELRLDREFINRRKAGYENRLKAIRNYITDETICRTRLLVKYFGEPVDEDCGICDVCAAKKKSGLNTAQFSKIVSAVENELKQSPLTAGQLSTKLGLQQKELNTVVEFLLDNGKAEMAGGGTIKWI